MLYLRFVKFAASHAGKSLNVWLMIDTWRLTGCHHIADQSVLTWTAPKCFLKAREAHTLLSIDKRCGNAEMQKWAEIQHPSRIV